MRGYEDSAIANRLAWRASRHCVDDPRMVINESNHSAVISVSNPELTIGVSDIRQGSVQVDLDEIKGLTHNPKSLRRNGKTHLDAIDLSLKGGEIVTLNTPPGKYVSGRRTASRRSWSVGSN